MLTHVRKLFVATLACTLLAGLVVRTEDVGDHASQREMDRLPGMLRARSPDQAEPGRTTSRMPGGRPGTESGLDIERLPRVDRTPPKRPAVDEDTLIVHHAGSVSDADYRAAGARRVASIEALDVDVIRTGDRKRSAAALARVRAIDAVEPNRMRYASAEPSDPGYIEQAHLFLSRFPIAWEISKGSAGMDIAVVDTGVDLDHPDLDSRITAGYDFVNGDTNAQDDNGHGTMVAGLAAAETNNGAGVSGAAWNARIIPIKVLDADGAGTDFELAQGIVSATDRGAEVINLSLGGPGSSEILEDAVAYATSRNVVVVAAAGNEATNVPSFPAAIPAVVAVGATDRNADTSAFTNYGSWVDLVAPGQDMVSTALVAGAEEAYAIGDGTSFAAPVVAGAALLHRARTTSATPAQIAAKLASSASDRGPRGLDDFYGRGLLDAYGAVGGRTAASPPAPPVDAHEPNDVPARATSITTTQNGTISPEGDTDWYAVDVPSEGTLSVTVSSLSSASFAIDPVLVIYGPDDRLVTEIDATGPNGNEHAEVYATSAGVYRFRVHSKLPTRSDMYRVDVGLDLQIETFAPYQSYPAGPHAENVAVADVTGDLRNDVLVTNGSGGPDNDYRLYVFPQRVDGSLGAPTSYRTDDAIWMDTGDLDGDGDTDVAIGSTNGIDVFTQRAGTLEGPTLVAQGLAGGHVTIADVLPAAGNEIVADGFGTNGAVPPGTNVLRREGSSWQSAKSGLPFVYEPHVGDVNSDGRPDIVGLTGYSGQQVRVLYQLADGSFVPTDLDGLFGYWTGLNDTTIGDVSGDGRADVVATVGGNFAGSRLNIFVQGADGMLAPATMQSSFDVAEAVSAADVNVDGLTDIVVAHGGWNEVGVYYQKPLGGLRDEVLSPIPYASHYAPRGLAVGDIDGDLLPDLAIADYNHGLVILRQNAAGAQTQPPLTIRSTMPANFATGVATNAHPTISFVPSLEPTTVTTTSVTLRDLTTNSAVASAPSYDDATKTVTLVPSKALVAGHTYGVTLAGLEDATGALLETADMWRFTVVRPATKPPARSDINGDGYDDVIVGAPGEDVGSLRDAGAFHVLLGSASGAKTIGSKLYTQDTKDVPGTAEGGDRFGEAIATGDVNADGYDDVAVGAPGEDLGSIADAGLVHVFLGSATGLRALGSQTWTQDSKNVPGAAEKADLLGAALVFGAFDDFAGDDLVIGAPGEAVNIVTNAGVVYVLSGRSSGLTAIGAKSWTRASAVGSYGSDDLFGAALTAGDFDADTHDDLVVGAPGAVTGRITLFNGTIVGPRPAREISSEMLTGQAPVPGERFGSAIAGDDFGGLASLDGYDDLAVGAPGAASGEGRVDIVFSDWMGPGLVTNSLRQIGNGNKAEAGDGFGTSLAAARTKAGTPAWLAVGAPGEDESGMSDVGVVHVTTPGTGFDNGMLAPPAIWQDSGPVQDAAESGDRFGARVGILDADKDGWPDVVVGSPGESAGTKAAAGTVHLLRHVDHLATTLSQQLVQGSGGLGGAAESGDRFGAAVTN